MSDFDSSQWADSEFSQEYRDYANDYIPERFRQIEIVKSLYKHFVQTTRTCSVLDLGCGDGLIMHQLLKVDDSMDATLVDGSLEMLETAKERLAGFEKVQFVQASFQDLLTEDRLQTTFDFILSSFAFITWRQMRRKRSMSISIVI